MLQCKVSYYANRTPDRHIKDNPKTILLLEDDETQAKTIEAFLRKHSYEVTVCHDGKAAIELARSQQPDIFIADIAMDGLNGSQAVQRISMIPECSEIGILFLSALLPQTDDDAVGSIKIGEHIFPCVSKATLGTRLLPVIENL